MLKLFPKWTWFELAVLLVLLISAMFLQNAWGAGMVVGAILTVGFGLLSWILDKNFGA